MSLQGVDMRWAPKPSTIGTLVRGNRVELQQVLVNLMLNAVDAMREAGTASPTIEILLSIVRKRAMLSVADCR